MADWTTIPNSSLEPGSPARSIDALALRDNPVAIAEGATGAPRVEDAGLSTTVTSAGQAWVSDRLPTDAVLNKIAGLTAGGVGTYAFLGTTTTGDYLPGSTLAGSSLRYAYIHRFQLNDQATASWANGNQAGITLRPETAPSAPSGTWRSLGHARYSQTTGADDYYYYPATLWVRIA
jgi:hypothetical protein